MVLGESGRVGTWRGGARIGESQFAGGSRPRQFGGHQAVRVESRRGAVAGGSGSRSSPAAFAFGPVSHSDPPARGQVHSSVSTPASRRQVPLNEVAFEFDPPRSSFAPPALLLRQGHGGLRRATAGFGGLRRAGGWGNVTASRQAHDGTACLPEAGRHRRPGVWHGHLAHVWHGRLARDFRGRPRPGSRHASGCDTRTGCPCHRGASGGAARFIRLDSVTFPGGGGPSAAVAARLRRGGEGNVA